LYRRRGASFLVERIAIGIPVEPIRGASGELAKRVAYALGIDAAR